MPDQQTPAPENNGQGGGAQAPPSRLVAQYAQLPELTQRKRRIGERIIEASIRIIAGLSIIFIFLIFFYVFREASPIILGNSSTPDSTAAASYELPPGADPDAAASAGGSAPQAGSTGAQDTEMVQYNPGHGIPHPADSAAGGSAGTAQDTGMVQYNPGHEIPHQSDSQSAAPSAGQDSEMVQYNPGHEIPHQSDSQSAAPSAGQDSEMVQYNPGHELPHQADSPSTAAIPTMRASSDSADKGPTPPAIYASDELARDIWRSGYPVLDRESPVKLSYLWHENWQPNSDHPRYGIWPILVGTAKTTFVSMLVATPLAILAALYTAFFAPRRLRETIKPVIELLAGFPSVVLGFFCLMTVGTIVQSIFGGDVRLNAVVGGIGLALAVIPIIYTITEDALRAVPLSLREAALALGATEWEAAYRVMLPAATPGIFAAVLLGLGRAIGETMIALMATGNAGTFNWDFFDSVRTFAATIGAEMGEVVGGSPHYQILFFLGIILFIFSFAINLVTEFYVKARLIKRFRGSE